MRPKRCRVYSQSSGRQRDPWFRTSALLLSMSDETLICLFFFFLTPTVINVGLLFRDFPGREF